MKKKESDSTVKKATKTAIVSNEVGSYEKHPYFVRKREAAKAFLKKAGVPAALVKKRS